ncbi:TPA: hypothetical protein I9Y23_004820 [Kluyvera ascorbata]|uniref:Uncharacterized protein n=1 Tax=Kluyvera genomosp. 2 TaxID=2774054 RepID=A0A2T2XVC5_9ENTR|nr:hypothetical protein [Kluyvera genomosp. 2]PSR44138.1 hypothetical protein C8256_24880 [Kluyvera genomosp. 2]HAT3921102.1 hypothetical protein [Kluyvera ascorbata]HAT3946031.1 hypothetical protein [Kluyvera ascorbata]HAT3951134.1 hypothetical protein [Kluyvera ascorbata]
MNDFELPALEYCSLERAARFIGSGCEADDLLHWATIGSIKLSHEFGIDEHVQAFVEFDGELIDVATKIFNSGQCDDYYINVSEFSFIATHLFEECSTVDDVIAVLTKHGDKPRVKAYLKGVWNISFFTCDFNNLNPFRIFNFSPLGDVCIDCDASINHEERYSKNDLLVSRDAVSVILGKANGLRKLPSMRNKPYLLMRENVETKENISNTVANNRASMIKALLAIHYGQDVADSPRKFFENKDSEICRDFDAKGISLPSGKTIAEWLKDADIDFIV